MKTIFLAAALMILSLGACVDTPTPKEATVGQKICTQEDIDNGTCGQQGGGDPQWVEIPTDSPDAQSSVTQLWYSYGVEARGCSFHTGNGGTGQPITCVTCSGDTVPGCGYHGGGCFYYCRVCVGDTSPGDTMCGVASVIR